MTFVFLGIKPPKVLAIGNAQAVEELKIREEHFRGALQEAADIQADIYKWYSWFQLERTTERKHFQEALDFQAKWGLMPAYCAANLPKWLRVSAGEK